MLVTRPLEIEAPNMVLLTMLCVEVPIVTLYGKSRVSIVNRISRQRVPPGCS